MAFLFITGEDFPGGPGVENLTANAGVTGLISELGRFHLPWSQEAWELRKLKAML